MFLLTRRQAHAALAGAAAAAAYYAAAEIGSKRPVRLGALFLLSSAALAGIVTQGSRASSKAYEVESRLNQFFTSGGQVGGDFHVNGDHYVSGAAHISGVGNVGSLNTAGDVLMNGNNISNCPKINSDGTNLDIWSSNAGFHGNLFMNGSSIHCVDAGGKYD